MGELNLDHIERAILRDLENRRRADVLWAPETDVNARLRHTAPFDLRDRRRPDDDCVGAVRAPAR
jgi:hypothetical protein